ncbi:MAG: hypothetical protein ACOH1V_02360 [Stenotrophomonas sp.]
MSAATEEIVTGKDLAAFIGCKPSYIVQLKKEGRVVPADGGKGYRKAASLALYQRTRDPAYAGVAQRHAAARGGVLAGADLPDADVGSSEDEDSELRPSDAARKSKALADKAEIDAKAAQRDYDLSIGKLLDAGEVEHFLAEAATTLRAELERLADTLAPQLAATADEARCRELLWSEHAHALEELSRRFKGIAKPVEVAA